MKKEFNYLKRDGQYFPSIPILLKRGDKKITTQALIDSGASFSLFHPDIAEYLGIEIEKGEKIHLTGIGGKILGYMHSVSVRLENNEFKMKIIFSPKFTVSFNLLGRDNFFIPFTISFAEKSKKVIIHG